MKLPQGLTVVSSSQSGSPLVCRLQKYLWLKTSFYAMRSTSSTVFLNVYVDDIILTGDDPQEISSLKMFLDEQFKIKDLGFRNYFLGIEILYDTSGVLLHHKKFYFELITEYGCSAASVVISPLELCVKLRSDVGELLPKLESY
uniref:Uncharacterized mitochondrial protein AtMg00810-like n=1 Tax=Nicotiana tabacum TaxID=4097 RepID=A0A1S4CVX3_TOBAC|nr:PREDICTED: uncharacterized mitochondrial protein AtMg00810-like [Nicotiana tabacum]